MASSAESLLCPGCGGRFGVNTGFVNHLIQSNNTACQQAYQKMVQISLNIAPDLDSGSEDEEAQFHGADYEENSENNISFDSDPENGPEIFDFSDSFDEPEDVNMDIEFDINMEDIALDLGPLPDLEEESDDDEDNEEYVW